MLHVTHAYPAAPEGGYPLIIGNEVTVGHNVTLHGCTIGDRCLIGMGSIVLDGARLEPEVLLGAGSLVPPNKVLEGGYLWLGNPAKKIRPLHRSRARVVRLLGTPLCPPGSQLPRVNQLAFREW